MTFDNSAETSGAMLGERVDQDPLPSPEPVSHRLDRGLDPPRPMIVAVALVSVVSTVWRVRRRRSDRNT